MKMYSWRAAAQLACILFSSGSLSAQVTAPEREVSIWSIDAPDLDSRKWEIEGPFAIGDPVHETLTRHALIRGKFVPEGVGRKNAQLAQVLRGVFWNDDPCAQLFSESIKNPLRPSTGFSWVYDFRAARSIGTGDFRALNCPLLGESHFGRFQFLHGMASSDGIDAQVTRNQIIGWISVVYRVAIGALDGRIPLSSDATALQLLGPLAALPPNELFRQATTAETRLRALGSLLHLVQDAFAPGHVERQDFSAIVQFLSYKNQNSGKHAHDDAWRQGKNEEEKIFATPGATQALNACTEIVAMYVRSAPWKEVEAYLIEGPFQLVAHPRASGPGKYK